MQTWGFTQFGKSAVTDHKPLIWTPDDGPTRGEPSRVFFGPLRGGETGKGSPKPKHAIYFDGDRWHIMYQAMPNQFLPETLPDKVIETTFGETIAAAIFADPETYKKIGGDFPLFSHETDRYDKPIKLKDGKPVITKASRECPQMFYFTSSNSEFPDQIPKLDSHYAAKTFMEKTLAGTWFTGNPLKYNGPWEPSAPMISIEQLLDDKAIAQLREAASNKKKIFLLFDPLDKTHFHAEEISDWYPAEAGRNGFNAEADQFKSRLIHTVTNFAKNSEQAPRPEL